MANSGPNTNGALPKFDSLELALNLYLRRIPIFRHIRAYAISGSSAHNIRPRKFWDEGCSTVRRCRGGLTRQVGFLCFSKVFVDDLTSLGLEKMLKFTKPV